MALAQDCLQKPYGHCSGHPRYCYIVFVTLFAEASPAKKKEDLEREGQQMRMRVDAVHHDQ